MSGTGKVLGHEADAGDERPGFGACDGFCEVFGQAAVAAESREGALDHPASR